MTVSTVPERPRFGLAATLAHHNFRRLWFSSLSFGSGQQMEMLILNWWILEVTNSPPLVGLMGGFRFWPSLLGPFVGVVADRFDRRRVLITVQSITALSGLTLFLLALSGHLQVWHAFALTLVTGAARTLDNATRQAAIGDLLPRERLINGMALNQVAMNGTAILAPPIGGILYSYFGLASGFGAVAALYGIGVLFTTGLPSLLPGPAKAGESAWRKLIDGLAFVRRDEALAALMWLAAIANLCGYTLAFGMLPIFARDVIGTDAAGFGVLSGAVGAGSLIGSLILGSVRGIGHRGRFIVAMMFAWMAVLIAFALTTSFVVALILLAFVGAGGSLSMGPLAAMLMDSSPISMRGRVMGVRMFAIATLPIATWLTGALIPALGPPLTLILTAGLGAVLTGLVVIRLPALWHRA